jgi:hypothetical protein
MIPRVDPPESDPARCYHYPMRILIAALVGLLAACSPEFDWREIRSVEHGWAAMLPGKPATLTRRIHLEATEVPMTMHGARVREAAFTVAAVDLPDDTPQTRAAALAAMRAGMLRNIGATQPKASVMQVGVVDPGGARLGQITGERIEASGAAQNRPTEMFAGFAAEGRRAWQWVVIGPALDREQAQTFLDGFRVMRPAP